MTKTRSIRRQPNERTQQIEEATRLMRKTLLDALVRATLTSSADQTPLRVTRASPATAPAQMAAAQASEATTREQITASYERCLESYRTLARAQGGDPDVDDVGRAVAFFVAVNLHALHGVDADAEMLQSLEQQLRGIAHARSNWVAASIEERQCFFERIAILSVVVSGSWSGAAAQGAEAVANVRRTARQYLEQMLGVNPDLVTLGPAGLIARHDSTPATAEQTA